MAIIIVQQGSVNGVCLSVDKGTINDSIFIRVLTG